MLRKKIEHLNAIANKIRQDILIMTAKAGEGHYMSSLSCVEILVSLFFSELHYNIDNPEDLGRDQFVLSKGHAAPALYAIMAESGYFPIEELKTLRKYNSRLQGHPILHRLPGLSTSSGSLGQGISTAVGIALASKIDKRNNRVFVLIGDGECQEGLVWEAAMSAAHFKLDNLIIIIDKNNLQISGPTDKIMSLGDLTAKWKSFGWAVFQVQGHNIENLLKVYNEIKTIKNQPIAIIADTIKGSGIPFIENNLKYHTAPLNEIELKTALESLM